MCHSFLLLIFGFLVFLLDFSISISIIPIFCFLPITSELIFIYCYLSICFNVEVWPQMWGLGIRAPIPQLASLSRGTLTRGWGLGEGEESIVSVVGQKVLELKDKQCIFLKDPFYSKFWEGKQFWIFEDPWRGMINVYSWNVLSSLRNSPQVSKIDRINVATSQL